MLSDANKLSHKFVLLHKAIWYSLYRKSPADIKILKASAADRSAFYALTVGNNWIYPQFGLKPWRSYKQNPVR